MLHRAHAALRVPGPPYRPEQMAREKEQDDRQIVARTKPSLIRVTVFETCDARCEYEGR